MYDCNRIKLKELNVSYNFFFYFDECLCNTDHEIFAIKCEKCVYKVVGFAINYFSSVNCLGHNINKTFACPHCKQLVHSLNLTFIKVCVKPNYLLNVYEDIKNL